MASVKNNLRLSFFAIIFIMFVSVSCTKENSPTFDLMEMPGTSAVLIFKGNFQNGPYGNYATGSASVYLKDSMYTLVFDSTFYISNGPALHVYLSKEIQPVNFIDLGNLKSTNGGQIYSIAGMPNFPEYKYALVYCKAYDHLFSYSELK